MKILLFGKDGQLGWELQRSLAPLGEVIALGKDNPGGDFTNPESIAQSVHLVMPDVIVNAAAYTAVDKAENEKELACLINMEAPAALAAAAKKYGAWLVHYSSDYVFNGSGEKPWIETDNMDPLNVYGITKRDGDEAIQASGCKHLIFRCSWIYAARGNNFIKTMIRLARERDNLKVVNDQTGTPTGADLIADITSHAIRTSQQRSDVAGLYHLTATGETTWYDYARFVLDNARQHGIELKVAPEAIIPVGTSDFPMSALRPHNSRLNTTKLQQTFGLSLPNWQIGVNRMIAEILEK